MKWRVHGYHKFSYITPQSTSSLTSRLNCNPLLALPYGREQHGLMRSDGSDKV
jgi:hypothetical protein